MARSCYITEKHPARPGGPAGCGEEASHGPSFWLWSEESISEAVALQGIMPLILQFLFSFRGSFNMCI